LPAPLRAALRFNDLEEPRLEWYYRFAKCSEGRIVDNAGTRTWGKVEERRVEMTLQGAQIPGRA
jgi:hypothetical protein